MHKHMCAHKCIFPCFGNRKVMGRCRHSGRGVSLPREIPTALWLSEDGSTKKYFCIICFHDLLKKINNFTVACGRVCDWVYWRAEPNWSSSRRIALVWSFGKDDGSSSLTTVSFTIKVRDRHFVWRRNCIMCGDASLILLMSHPSSSQTAEKNLFWGASHCQATKSCSARRGNARTESSPLRYYC